MFLIKRFVFSRMIKMRVTRQNHWNLHTSWAETLNSCDINVYSFGAFYWQRRIYGPDNLFETWKIIFSSQRFFPLNFFVEIKSWGVGEFFRLTVAWCFWNSILDVFICMTCSWVGYWNIMNNFFYLIFKSIFLDK